MIANRYKRQDMSVIRKTAYKAVAPDITMCYYLIGRWLFLLMIQYGPDNTFFSRLTPDAQVERGILHGFRLV